MNNFKSKTTVCFHPKKERILSVISSQNPGNENNKDNKTMSGKKK